MFEQKAKLHSVEAWLTEWARAIDANDIDAGRRLFRRKASGFGAITFTTSGLDDLVERQWRSIWSRTKGFAFERENQVVTVSDDGQLATMQTAWNSMPIKGECESRRGRATIILLWHDDVDDWKCIHTHFSIWPAGANQKLGAPIS